jgi:anti-anti-sigma factor
MFMNSIMDNNLSDNSNGITGMASSVSDSQVTNHGCIIESRKSGHDTVIVDMRGNLTGLCEKALSQTFNEGAAAAKRIILNLSGLMHMDTEGAGLLLISASQALRRHIALSAFGLPGSYRNVFHLMGLDELMALYEDEKDALNCRRFPGKGGPSFSSLPLLPATTQTPPGWAKSVDHQSLAGIPEGVMNINVAGRRPSSPVHGFGRLWDKRYRLRLDDTDLEPRQIISLWRDEFPDFWPKGNHLFTSGNAAIAPGTAVLLNLALPGGLVMATGIMVIYVDEASFSFMAIEGHILSGWITFSCFHENTSTIIQVHPLFRTGDPLIELGFRLGGAAQEDRFWHETLGNLAHRLGTQGNMEQQNVLIDPHFQWNKFGNLRKSAAIRSSLYMPVYMLKKYMAAKKGRRRNGNP